MMVEQFIDRLEQQGLLDKETLADLRRKVVRAKGKKITPKALAKYLVDRGHLTRFQAIKLVGDISALPDSGTIRAGKPKTEDKANSDELRLLPDDLVGPMRETLELPTAPAGKSPEQIGLDELTAIDDDLMTPKPAAAKPADLPPETPAAKAKRPEAVTRTATRKPESVPAPPPAPAKSFEPPPSVAPAADDLLSDLESAGRLSGASGGGTKPPLQRKLQKTSEWDSMLLLSGGVSLGVLLVIGAFLYMSLTKGAAEDMIGAAETAYGKESYTEAIRLYDDYLEAHPRHEKASRRVCIAKSLECGRFTEPPTKVSRSRRKCSPWSKRKRVSRTPAMSLRAFCRRLRRLCGRGAPGERNIRSASTPGQGGRRDETGRQRQLCHLRTPQDPTGVD